MAETTKLQVFTLENLRTYDPLLKEWVLEQITGKVSESDAKSLKTVAIEGNTLKFYRVEEPVGETAPAYTIELPEQDLSGLLAKLENATAGHVVTVAEDGTTITDSGVAIADLATKGEVEAVDGKADKNAEDIAAINDSETGLLKQAKDYADAEVSKVQGSVDDLVEYVGTIPEGSTATDIVGYVQEKTSGIASSDNLNALGERVTQAEKDIDKNAEDIAAEKERAEGIEAGLEARLKTVEDDYLKKADKDELVADIQENADAIGVLNGDSTVEGSVDKKVADAINTFATQITDDGTINTYKEVLNYIATHGGEASEMMAAIDALEELVGEKSVATQIAEAITAENLSQYATDEELAAAIARIVVLEGKAHEHENEEVLNGITAEKVAAWDAAEQNAKDHADAEIAKTNENVTANTEDIADIKEQIAQIQENAYDDTELRELVGQNTSDINDLKDSLAEGGATANAIADAKKTGTDAAAAAATAQSEVDALEAQVLADKNAQSTKDQEQDAAITEAKNAADAAQADVDLVETDLATTKEAVSTNTTNISSNSDRITALENLTGAGYEAIPNDVIAGLFAETEA